MISDQHILARGRDEVRQMLTESYIAVGSLSMLAQDVNKLRHPNAMSLDRCDNIYQKEDDAFVLSKCKKSEKTSECQFTRKRVKATQKKLLSTRKREKREKK